LDRSIAGLPGSEAQMLDMEGGLVEQLRDVPYELDGC
jgi:hypothetical protein